MDSKFIEVNKQIMEVKLLEMEFDDNNEMTFKVLVKNGKDVMNNIKKIYTDKDMTTEVKVSSFVDYYISVFNNTEHNLDAYLIINDADNTLSISRLDNEFHILDGMQVKKVKLIPVKKLVFDGDRIIAYTSETLPFYKDLEELNYYNEREVVNYQDGSISTIGGEHKLWDLDKDQTEAWENFIKSYKKLRETGIALFLNCDEDIYALNSKGKSITCGGFADDSYSEIPEQAWIDINECLNYISDDEGMFYKQLDEK
ncbi:MAG: hypothetical protein J5767_12650 [Paludibacteraceae bacterium]|nr:hypothetical protein [Paludibacteraceae bacterium]